MNPDLRISMCCLVTLCEIGVCSTRRTATMERTDCLIQSEINVTASYSYKRRLLTVLIMRLLGKGFKI